VFITQHIAGNGIILYTTDIILSLQKILSDFQNTASFERASAKSVELFLGEEVVLANQALYCLASLLATDCGSISIYIYLCVNLEKIPWHIKFKRLFKKLCGRILLKTQPCVFRDNEIAYRCEDRKN
jgi:hypothetical protein